MFVSDDMHWTVTPVSIDNRKLLRVEHDTVLIRPGEAVPAHWARDGLRCGVTRTAHGYLVADLTSVSEVAKWVDLSTLKEVR